MRVKGPPGRPRVRGPGGGWRCQGGRNPRTQPGEGGWGERHSVNERSLQLVKQQETHVRKHLSPAGHNRRRKRGLRGLVHRSSRFPPSPLAPSPGPACAGLLTWPPPRHCRLAVAFGQADFAAPPLWAAPSARSALALTSLGFNDQLLQQAPQGAVWQGKGGESPYSSWEAHECWWDEYVKE